ncbi:hypothetical protein CEQ36_05180 [Yersinia intermedia]|nr:hypothetical protein A6J67_23285 [Yersinia sp. FDAARGOS_228]AVL35080.1 hypothetical protein CEQ36_05180 [Yersinia intermedia]
MTHKRISVPVNSNKARALHRKRLTGGRVAWWMVSHNMAGFIPYLTLGVSIRPMVVVNLMAK